MKKSKPSQQARAARRRRVRTLGLQMLDKRLVLSAAPPVAVNDAFSAPADAPLSISSPGVLANDTDAEGDALTASLFSGPAHGTLSLQADGSFDYTPDSGFSGIDSFTYFAGDGTSDSTLAAVTLRIGVGGQAPAIDLDADDSAASGADFAASFSEGGGPVLLADSDAALSDAGSAEPQLADRLDHEPAGRRPREFVGRYGGDFHQCLVRQRFRRAHVVRRR